MPRGGRRPGAGAPRGNFNALKHGRHSPRVRNVLEGMLADPLTRVVLLELGRKGAIRKERFRDTVITMTRMIHDRPMAEDVRRRTHQLIADHIGRFDDARARGERTAPSPAEQRRQERKLYDHFRRMDARLAAERRAEGDWLNTSRTYRLRPRRDSGPDRLALYRRHPDPDPAVPDDAHLTPLLNIATGTTLPDDAATPDPPPRFTTVLRRPHHAAPPRPGIRRARYAPTPGSPSGASPPVPHHPATLAGHSPSLSQTERGSGGEVLPPTTPASTDPRPSQSPETSHQPTNPGSPSGRTPPGGSLPSTPTRHSPSLSPTERGPGGEVPPPPGSPASINPNRPEQSDAESTAPHENPKVKNSSRQSNPKAAPRRRPVVRPPTSTRPTDILPPSEGQS